MEVHHHPKLDHKAKPWKEYLLEGIMIFIAVSLGYAAENLREHFLENKKAIVMARNLFFDVKADSATMAKTLRNRANQDSCFEIVNEYYNNNTIKNKIPELYAAHSRMTLRMLPIMNSLALEQIKNSGALNYVEDENLKILIQAYDGLNRGLKLRENREFDYINRFVDPLTLTNFKYKFYREINGKVRIENNMLTIKIPVPDHLALNKQNEFDWDTYFSVMGMLKTIRNSTDRDYIFGAQKECNKLLAALRKMLIEHNQIIN